MGEISGVILLIASSAAALHEHPSRDRARRRCCLRLLCDLAAFAVAIEIYSKSIALQLEEPSNRGLQSYLGQRKWELAPEDSNPALIRQLGRM